MPELPVLNRQDHVNSIKFLTSCAAALAEMQMLSAHDADDLRIILSDTHRQDSTVLINLADQKAEFLTLLTARYSPIGLCLNLYRYTAAGELNAILKSLHGFGERILSRAQSLFNRPFRIFLYGHCEKTALFASALIDLSELIDQSCAQIEGARNQLSCLHGNNLAFSGLDDAGLDEKVCVELGFHSVSDDTLPFVREQAVNLQVCGALQQLALGWQEFIEQLRQNKDKDDTAKAVVLLDTLRADLQLVQAFQLPKTNELSIWENRRLILINTLQNIQVVIDQIAAVFLEEVTALSKINEPKRQLQGQDIECAMSSELIRTGVPAQKAEEAARALLKYKTDQNISAREILAGELHKINPHLTTTSLEHLQEIEADHLMQKTARKKQANLERHQLLFEKFHQKLVNLGLVVFLTALLPNILSGCGLKLLPKSNLVDYRPTVSYHERRERTVSSSPEIQNEQNSFIQKDQPQGQKTGDQRDE